MFRNVCYRQERVRVRDADIGPAQGVPDVPLVDGRELQERRDLRVVRAAGSGRHGEWRAGAPRAARGRRRERGGNRNVPQDGQCKKEEDGSHYWEVSVSQSPLSGAFRGHMDCGNAVRPALFSRPFAVAASSANERPAARR